VARACGVVKIALGTPGVSGLWPHTDAGSGARPDSTVRSVSGTGKLCVKPAQGYTRHDERVVRSGERPRLTAAVGPGKKRCSEPTCKKPPNSRGRGRSVPWEAQRAGR